MKKLLRGIALFLALIAALLAIPLLFISGNEKAPAVDDALLPWNIERLPGGATRVFGLTLGESTLDDAYRRFGEEARVALIAAQGESGSVEAFYEHFNAGFITGKMILTLETSQAQRAALLARAVKAEITENAARRITLAAVDLEDLRHARIAGITFIPSADLDAESVRQRFAMPAETIRLDERITHWLYPDKGLDVRLDAKGKEVLQYVAPMDFTRLRDPLLAAGRS
ncbi:hypothetical protein [Sulfuricystis multivorans]|uniref:hypothetical protein n=1 Tax=Sulfuricystis multivorans TaxID=2211108 RepID=UPI000F84A4C1|nr:hypothetical protein [Sulfuricystis multivorans]